MIFILVQTSIKLKINKCTGSIIYPKHTETNDKHWMTEEGWNGVEVLTQDQCSGKCREKLISAGGDSNQLYHFIYKKK